MSGDCLFCKIGNGTIPANKLYEDDELLAFWDINPQAPKHFLVIPKKHLSGPGAVSAAEAELIGRLIARAGELARQQGIGDGFRLVLNNGAAAGQTVFHLHLHVLGGRALGWPPG
jgi:histidine triad (HIT) family protein